MRYRYIIAAVLCAVLCGCNADTAEKTEVTETTAETSETTVNYDFALVRTWTGDELMNSIYYCGGYHPMPTPLADNPDFTLSDGLLTMPTGYAEASADENMNITSIHFSEATAPSDFSVMGIDFDSRPSEIPEKVGFADYIEGTEEETIEYRFFGGGVKQLVFIFTERKLTDVFISV